MNKAKSMLKSNLAVRHSNLGCTHLIPEPALTEHLGHTDIILDKPNTSASGKRKISLQNPHIFTENLDDTASISSMDAVIDFQSGNDADHSAWSNHDIQSATDADHSVFSNQTSFLTPLCNRRTSTASKNINCDVRSMSMNIESPQLITTVSTLISNELNCPSPVHACPDQNVCLESGNKHQQNMSTSDTRGTKIVQVRPISSIPSLNLNDAYFRPIDSKPRQKQIQPLQLEQKKQKQMDFELQESLVMQRQHTTGTSGSTSFYKQSRNLFQHDHQFHQQQQRYDDVPSSFLEEQRNQQDQQLLLQHIRQHNPAQNNESLRQLIQAQKQKQNQLLQLQRLNQHVYKQQQQEKEQELQRKENEIKQQEQLRLQKELQKQDRYQRVLMMNKQEEQRRRQREQEDYSLRGSVMYGDREVHYTIPVCRENAQKVLKKFEFDQLCAFCFLDLGVILHACSGCERFFHPECGEKATLKFSGMFSQYCAFCVCCITCKTSLVGRRSNKCPVCQIPRCDECIKHNIRCVCRLT